jgi:hypothetical protein
LPSEQPTARLSELELDAIRRYAEEFRFVLEGEVIVRPERPDTAAARAIQRAAEIGERRHLPYAALFVLRIYYEHKKLYYQSYSLNGFCEPRFCKGVCGCELADEFIRLAKPVRSPELGYATYYCYDWVKRNKSLFADYPPVEEELSKIEQLQEQLDNRFRKRAAESFMKELERFAMEAPIDRPGRAPAAIPVHIDHILRRFRDEGRTDHLPYLLEYGLNIYLKNLAMSKLARVMPVDDNVMLAELVRLTGIDKYKSFHEAGWLGRQFHRSVDGGRCGPPDESGYSSYQIYVWYLENWSSLLNRPNIDRLCDLQKQIEDTGMHGVGGGRVCHYGCR